jgi:hypothetical protein
VTFVGSDSATLGNWPAQYGADGYAIAGGPQNLPAYASLVIQNESFWTWAASTTDPRALQIPGGGSGVGSTWYSASSFSLDVNIATGSHQLALYAVDWDSQGRSETIQIVDPATNNVLSSTSISNFTNGIYLIWNVAGHVTIVVTASSGPNAVVSGVFFGGPAATGASPVLKIAKTHSGNFTQGQQGATYTVTVSNATGAAPTTGTVTVTETAPSGLTLTSMTGTGWNCATNTCTRSDALGGGSSYAPIRVTVNVAANASSPQVNQVSVSGGGSATANASDSATVEPVGGVSSASWVTSDTTTEGTWMGLYGTQGYWLATGNQTISIPATLTVANESTWTWAGSTSDPRALQTDNTGDRAATTWYSAGHFSFDLNLTDGQSHEVAIYVIDWDHMGRSETISISDANSGTVLDTRTIPNSTSGSAAYTNTTATNFGGGTYLVWNIGGHVTITVTPNSGPNAVVSAIFLDPNLRPSVVYTLTGSVNPALGPVHAESFQFTTSSFITSTINLDASQLDSCVACAPSGTAVQFFPNGTTNVVVPVDYVNITDANGVVYGFFFPPGTFSASGTYTASDYPPYIVSNIGILTVRAKP